MVVGAGRRAAAERALTDARTLRALRCARGRRGRVFPADTVYGLGLRSRTRADAVARLYALKGRPPDKPAAVMFFALEPALAALPELGARTRARARAAAARRRDRSCCRTRAAASRSHAGRTRRRSGCACRRARRCAGVRRPVLQSSANLAGGADARRLADVPERDPRRRRPRARRRRAAGHAVDGRGPARLRGGGRVGGRCASGRWPPGAAGVLRSSDRDLAGDRHDRLQPDYFERPLAEVDPEVAEAVGPRARRQQRTLEMIALGELRPRRRSSSARAAC